jgi:hypothetical protein
MGTATQELTTNMTSHTVHTVKSWSHFYDAIVEGKKLHDLRKDDRNYKVGDTLILCRYDIKTGEYTGEQCWRKISYITSNKYPCAYSSAVLPHEYVILSLYEGTEQDYD